jgi:hypothetical protein
LADGLELVGDLAKQFAGQAAELPLTAENRTESPAADGTPRDTVAGRQPASFTW